MKLAPVPANEDKRIDALLEYEILDTLPEAAFDAITKLASEIFDVPLSTISFIDRTRQWFKSVHGADISETPRDTSFCGHLILQDDLFVVEDAALDPRFANNPAVLGNPGIRFFAGMPIKVVGDYNLGGLCVIDYEPRKITPKQAEILKQLTQMITHEIEMRISIKRLKSNQSKALQSEKLATIGRLSAGVAHEINTPLQYVETNAEFLKEGYENFYATITDLRETLHKPDQAPLATLQTIRGTLEDDELAYYVNEAPKALAQALEGISRVKSLVNAMKSFSHTTNTEKSLENLNRGIQLTLTLTRNSWKYDVDLTQDLDETLPQVYCNLNEINQVLLNLVINAAQSIEEHRANGNTRRGLIQIRSFQQAGNAVVEVEDNGPGIPKEVVSKIFEPFFTTKPVNVGSGQGLAISYDIVVRRHGGRLDVETSTEKQQTIFRISLPTSEKPTSLQKTDLHNIVYLSNAVTHEAMKDVVSKLSHYRTLNASVGITGLLLCQRGSFLQVLEGEKDAVCDLYLKIRQDPRHSAVFTIVDAPAQERQFEDWSMGFLDLDIDPPKDMEGFNEFLESPFSAEIFFSKSGRFNSLLNHFKELKHKDSKLAH